MQVDAIAVLKLKAQILATPLNAGYDLPGDQRGKAARIRIRYDLRMADFRAYNLPPHDQRLNDSADCFDLRQFRHRLTFLVLLTF